MRHTEVGQQNADDPAKLAEPVLEDEALTKIVDAADTLANAETLHAPETEIGEASEHTLHLYSKLAPAHRAPRQFAEYELVTGNYRSREWADPALLAEAHQKWSRERDLRQLAQESTAADFDLPGTLQDLRNFVTRMEEEARARAKAVVTLKHRMRRVARLEDRTAAELAQLADLRAFAEPLARDAWTKPTARGKAHERDLDALLAGSVRLTPQGQAADLLAIFYANSETDGNP